jgi:hypothetical protein
MKRIVPLALLLAVAPLVTPGTPAQTTTSPLQPPRPNSRPFAGGPSGSGTSTCAPTACPLNAPSTWIRLEDFANPNVLYPKPGAPARMPLTLTFPVVAPAAPVARPQTGGGLVGELVAILNETKSKDTFLVTVAALQKIGPEARASAPAIIRNADRLGLLRGISREPKKETSKGRAAEVVLEALDEVLGGNHARTGQPRQAPCTVPASCIDSLSLPR